MHSKCTLDPLMSFGPEAAFDISQILDMLSVQLVVCCAWPADAATAAATAPWLVLLLLLLLVLLVVVLLLLLLLYVFYHVHIGGREAPPL